MNLIKVVSSMFKKHKLFFVDIGNYQRWAQIKLYQKRNATKRNNIFNLQKRSAKCAIYFFLISEAHRNFCNELFDSVEAQRNSAIAERHFRTK